MKHFDYHTKGTCSTVISFDLDGDIVHNISYTGGCNGNLKAISAILEGTSVDFIESKVRGIMCGMKGTSCSDQLAQAVRAAYDGVLEPSPCPLS